MLKPTPEQFERAAAAAAVQATQVNGDTQNALRRRLYDSRENVSYQQKQIENIDVIRHLMVARGNKK